MIETKKEHEDRMIAKMISTYLEKGLFISLKQADLAAKYYGLILGE